MVKALKNSLIIFLALHLVFCTSCKGTYPNIMFQNKDYSPIAPKVEAVKDAYIIKEGDELTIKVYSRKGINLVDVLTEPKSGEIKQIFLVDINGMADLPIIGYYKVSGMKEAELKSKLEKEYEKLFNEPFVFLKVENRRAFVFKGSQGLVVQLNRAPTNIIEVIAKAGGLDRSLKAYNIKIIRGNLKNPEVLQIDLSTMQGMTAADLTIQTNDIVYIEERQRPVYQSIIDIAPLITLPISVLSFTVSLITLLRR